MVRSRFAEYSPANPRAMAEAKEHNERMSKLATTIDPRDAHIAQLQKSNVELQEQRHALQMSHDALFEAFENLLTSAKILHQNAVGCAVNHYGEDYEIHGLPDWLAGTEMDIINADLIRSAARPLVREGEG